MDEKASTLLIEVATSGGLGPRPVQVGRHRIAATLEHPTPLDNSELRDQARLMVDSQLSDHKKQMLTLLRRGLNQSKIAKELHVERQAVSKVLRKIPAVFRLDNVPRKLQVVRAGEAQAPA